MSDPSSASSLASEALQVLTEQVFTNMKLATPALEELLKAASKYHAAMEQANAAAQVFVDALGKVAVTANRGRAATHELGQSMQKIASQHHKMVADRDIQTRKMQTQFIVPLQKRLRTEQKTFGKMEDDFKGMTKQYKNELKKAGQSTIKAQKTAAKKSKDEHAQEVMQKALKTMLHKSKSFEAFNQRCLRACLIEERRRYCYLMDNYVSVFEDDLRNSGAAALVREVLELSGAPEQLPDSSLELIARNGSNGVMFEVPVGAGEEKEKSLRSIEPSPLTKELEQRFHNHDDHDDQPHLLPPGCPPGGLRSHTSTDDLDANQSRRSRRSPSS
ncbi:hypothetical protein PTSG_01392 [Salpingoeca rosetta]|uniref:IMD domain-containing protein n=1 Tax=Salpingoeca rosetta (strain ATCC 50818 / BSB-021) TaxID=946362 RepID=F2U075_SALR5|nr:uncharacterized protein PTSG_01392 [Salpingoeca rosetta]EGD80803.1 hypothetical protein PTSG_01392 [Salpingoeca rosetta]|eukprot:XP_004997364.1 hypothetical protein PTSG_01392 [Salpingoeca rosetta]